MSENQSLSKPSKPPDQGAVNIPGSQAPKSRREASTSRRNRRINRLFTELDQEIIDLDAAPAPSEDGENTPIEDPSIEEELQCSALRQPDNGRPLSEAISPAEGAIEHPIVADSPDLDDVEPPRPDPGSRVSLPNLVRYPDADNTRDQSRPFKPAWSKELGYQASLDRRHSTTEGEQVLPTTKVLTQTGWESLRRGKLISGKDQDQFATLAYALPFGERKPDPLPLEEKEQATLLLEIVDENPGRQWKEDELLLVEQVTDQLSLALENARLFEEAHTRSEYLAILNDMSQALSTQLKSEQVIDTVYHYSAQLVEASNCYIALYHQDTQEVTFPLVIENRERAGRFPHPISHGLPGYIYQTRKTLLIKEYVKEWVADDLQIEETDRDLESYLGVPMISGDQVIGMIAVQSFEPSLSYNENDRDLLHAVASQAAVALLNAQLFEQTQTALSALEVSERYQKGVANAVGILTERGIASLSDVLEILGTAADASRAYYFETQVDGRGRYWRLITEWLAPGIDSLLNNASLRRVSSESMASWMDKLHEDGYAFSTTYDLPPEQKSFFESLGTQSVLHLAVPGRHELPGCIGFEQTDYDRIWGRDEIAALQTAASALANTIAREDLFTQVQLNLAETEALYQASAHLNSAKTYDEILQVLRQHTILGHVNISTITLNVFDKTWKYDRKGELGERPDWLIPLSCWSAQPDNQLVSERIALDSWPGLEELIQPEHPTKIMDIENDTRISGIGRDTYINLMDAKSLLIIPLNVAGQWIGFIISVYRQTTGFPEQDVRRLTSLAGQAAIAISGLRSLEETRRRNEELAILNQITSAASKTLELDDVLDEILERVLSVTNYGRGLISVLDPLTKKLALAVHRNLPENMIRKLRAQGLDNTPCDLVYRLERTISIPDLTDIETASPDLLPWKNVFQGPITMGFRGYVGVPLISKGQVLGTVCIFNDESLVVDPSRITLLEAAGQQVGVVVENAELFAETEKALSETETLYQADAELSAVESYNDILSTLRKYTVLGQADKLAYIALFNRPSKGDERPEFVTPIAHWTSLNIDNLTLSHNLKKYQASLPLSPNQPTIFEDLHGDPRLDQGFRSRIVGEFQAGSAIFIPLTVGGDRIGYVNGVYSDARQFSEAQVRRFVSLASQAAVAVQNLRLFEETRRRANQLQTAAEIARDTSSALNLEMLLERAVNLIRDRFGYYHASIFMLEEGNKLAVVQESTGEAGAELKRQKHSLPVGGNSVIGQVTATGEYLVVNDVTLEHAGVHHYSNPLLPETRAELGIPLKTGDRVIGALDVQASRTEAFTQDDINVLQTLADQIAVALNNARAYELAQQAMAEIREADRLKSQFLANMSHELRTPLNSIIGFSRVILKGIDGPINDLQQQDLSAIYNSGQHLLGLINDVLDLSKIEAGKMELAFEDDVNLEDIIKGVMSTTSGLVKDKSIDLCQDIAPNLPILRIDPIKVRQVLLNLLSNAAKFTEVGSITVSASVQSSPNDDQEVFISVTDTGSGISPEDQLKLFMPFSQVDGSLTRKTGGSGLGLSICQHLIHMHGGRIGLRSTVGKGSTFYFTLPLEGVEEPLKIDFLNKPELPDTAGLQWSDQYKYDPGKEHKPNIQSSSANFIDTKVAKNGELIQGKQPPPDQVYSPSELNSKTKGLILAIDADHQVIDFYRRYLSSHGYRIIAVTELSQAITVAQGVHPNFITLDISMPSGNETEDGKLDGWKVLRDLKSNPITQNIPVVICSLIDERDKALELGADDYLVKPILATDLASTIDRLRKD